MRSIAIVIALLAALAAPAAAQTDPDAGVDPAEGSAGDPSDAADPTDPGPGATTGGGTTTGTSATGTNATGTSATGTTTTGTSASGTSATGTSATGTSASASGTSAGTTSSAVGASGASSEGHAAGTGTMSASRAAPPPYRDDEHDDDEEEDEGDPYDFLWIELMGGYSYVDLRAISYENFYPDTVTLRGDGPMGGAAVGFRIEFFSAGVRAAVAHYADDFDVGTATAEITLAIPIPIVKPFLRAGFGLGWHGDSNFMAPEMSQTTVFGWAFSGAVGADIYFVDWFALGVAGTIDILNMSRQSIDDPVTDPGAVSFEDTGDAVGIQARAHIAASFHF